MNVDKLLSLAQARVGHTVPWHKTYQLFSWKWKAAVKPSWAKSLHLFDSGGGDQVANLRLDVSDFRLTRVSQGVKSVQTRSMLERGYTREQEVHCSNQLFSM